MADAEIAAGDQVTADCKEDENGDVPEVSMLVFREIDERLSTRASEDERTREQPG